MFGKKQVCELVMIVDRSGSMSSCKQEVIEGMNKLISEQREVPGKCFLTGVIFDHEYEVGHESRDIREIGYWTDEDYVPRGQTALYDAIGRTIEACRVRFSKTKPDRIVCVIVTDGCENASKEFTQVQIRKLVESMSDWTFVYIGSNQDAVLTAKEIAMPTAGAFTAAPGKRGIKQAFTYACNVSSELRTSNDVGSINYAALQDDARNDVDIVKSTVE